VARSSPPLAFVAVPEGDTIHHAAARIRPVLQGRVPDAVLTPHRRHALDRWPARLDGRAVRAVDARGKHLFIRFDGDLVIHSHLRMHGAWSVRRTGERWPRGAHRAWLVLRADGHDVVQFDGPVLELMTESRARFDQRLAALGPDIVADAFDEAAVLARLRRDDPARTIGDALMDQRTIAGIGNVWKSEACFGAGIDPWRPAAQVSDEEVLAILEAARPRMRRCARDGHSAREHAIYGRAGRPCPRCGAPISRRGQGDDNRSTYWCASCQR
jgi:endonuclease VIII